MKKRFLLMALMIITGICLCTNNQNSLKACVKEAVACPVSIKQEIKMNTVFYGEDDPFYIGMNPVTQL